MNQYPDMVIELASHTDSQGRYAYNERLSQRRADSATKWLVEKGVPAERMQAKGYGETQILNHCTNGVKCSDEEHRFNRRTVFTIIAGPTEIKIEKKRLKKNS
jgi:outer membrane protein OmpA-like peptidoglycan-associated protein